MRAHAVARDCLHSLCSYICVMAPETTPAAARRSNRVRGDPPTIEPALASEQPDLTFSARCANAVSAIGAVFLGSPSPAPPPVAALPSLPSSMPAMTSRPRRSNAGMNLGRGTSVSEAIDASRVRRRVRALEAAAAPPPSSCTDLASDPSRATPAGPPPSPTWGDVLAAGDSATTSASSATSAPVAPAAGTAVRPPSLPATADSVSGPDGSAQAASLAGRRLAEQRALAAAAGRGAPVGHGAVDAAAGPALAAVASAAESVVELTAVKSAVTMHLESSGERTLVNLIPAFIELGAEVPADLGEYFLPGADSLSQLKSDLAEVGASISITAYKKLKRLFASVAASAAAVASAPAASAPAPASSAGHELLGHLLGGLPPSSCPPPGSTGSRAGAAIFTGVPGACTSGSSSACPPPLAPVPLCAHGGVPLGGTQLPAFCCAPLALVPQLFATLTDSERSEATIVPLIDALLSIAGVSRASTSDPELLAESLEADVLRPLAAAKLDFAPATSGARAIRMHLRSQWEALSVIRRASPTNAPPRPNTPPPPPPDVSSAWGDSRKPSLAETRARTRVEAVAADETTSATLLKLVALTDEAFLEGFASSCRDNLPLHDLLRTASIPIPHSGARSRDAPRFALLGELGSEEGTDGSMLFRVARAAVDVQQIWIQTAARLRLTAVKVNHPEALAKAALFGEIASSPSATASSFSIIDMDKDTSSKSIVGSSGDRRALDSMQQIQAALIEANPRDSTITAAMLSMHATATATDETAPLSVMIDAVYGSVFRLMHETFAAFQSRNVPIATLMELWKQVQAKGEIESARKKSSDGKIDGLEKRVEKSEKESKELKSELAKLKTEFKQLSDKLSKLGKQPSKTSEEEESETRAPNSTPRGKQYGQRSKETLTNDVRYSKLRIERYKTELAELNAAAQAADATQEAKDAAAAKQAELTAEQSELNKANQALARK